MKVVNPQAAGVDVGSRSHWVAVGQSEKDVREFGVYNQDLFALADWLKEANVKTIAMESTGTYWQNLFAVLISKGFHVILCNGKFTAAADRQKYPGQEDRHQRLPMDTEIAHAWSFDQQFPPRWKN